MRPEKESPVLIKSHRISLTEVIDNTDRDKTFYTLRSVRRKSFQYAVKFLLFLKPFLNFVPPKNSSGGKEKF